jgi:hypothetical protein
MGLGMHAGMQTTRSSEADNNIAKHTHKSNIVFLE